MLLSAWRSGRRPLVRGAAALAATALAAALAGCGAGEDTAAAGAPVDGGTLTYAVDSEPSCLDPHVSPADLTALIGRGVFDSLIAQDGKGGLHPWLAKSWTASPDFKSYTFTLRTGVKFHDGTPFDANAVKANFDHIAAPATKSLYAVTLLGPYAGSTVLAPDTVRVDFKRPFSPFLQAASTTYLGIESPQALRQFATSLCDHLVGSGPFTFAGHVHQQTVTIARNPAYAWAPETATHPGPARLDQVVFRIVPESATRIGLLTSGQIDAVTAVPPANVKTVEADPALQLVRNPSQGATESLYLNTARAPFDDVKVRTALQQAIDVDAAVRGVYFGQYERSWSILSPSTPGYDPATEHSWGHDPAAANRLLDEAGWTARDAEGYRTKNGQRLSVRWPYTQAQALAQQRGTLAQAIQADARKVGLEIQRPSVQTGQLFALVEKGDYELADTSWTRADPDILRGFLTSDNFPIHGENYSRVTDQQVDSWLNGAAATLDDGTRRTAYAQAQQWALKQAVVVPLFVPSSLVGAKKKVQGLTADPAGFPQFRDAWLAR
ncbi:ABC transporter substrate-binding protein [Amycolatopsis sp. lyj-23]|uniref:ABC transporter substrate-binding protein n=1 Tax=Amycolatopsis sp. lyj-23 TaxID=2789283 RepID=UPI0039785D62